MNLGIYSWREGAGFRRIHMRMSGTCELGNTSHINADGLCSAPIVGRALQFRLLHVSLLLEKAHLIRLLLKGFAGIPGRDDGKES